MLLFLALAPAVAAGPARPSFDADGQIRLLNVDLGGFRPGDVAQAWIEIFNVPSNVVATAPLTVRRIEGSGNVEQIRIDLAPFAGLAAGQSRRFIASFDTSTPGSFNATYTLWFGDSSDPGELTDATMTIRLVASVVGSATPTGLSAPEVEEPEPGGVLLFLAAAAGLLAWSWYRRRQVRRSA